MKACLSRLRCNESGIILPLVLVFLALGMLLIAPTLGHGYAGLSGTSVTESKAMELHAADAGVEDALHWLLHGHSGDGRYVESSPGFWQRSADLQLNESTVNISIEQIGDGYLVSAAALGPRGSTSVDAFIELEMESGGGHVFNNAVTTLGGNVTIGGGSKVHSDPPEDKAGDVYSAGHLFLNPSASIAGNVYADSGITLGWGTTIDGDAYSPGEINEPDWSPDLVTGDSYPGSPHEDPESLTDDEVSDLVDDALSATDFAHQPAGPVTRPSNWTIGWWPPPNDQYLAPEHIAGNLTINTGTSIVFNSSVHVDGNLTINSSGRTFIFEGPVFVSGTVTVQNGHAVFDSLWIGNDLNLAGSGTAEFQGPVRVGNDMDLGSGGDVTFGDTIFVGRDFKASGSRTIDLEDTVYVARHISLTGSSKFVGGHNIVALGNVTLAGATKIENADDLPFLLAPSGTFSVSGSGYASIVVYAPEADVSLSGSAKIYGAVVSNSITITGSAEVEYPVSLRDRTDLPGSGSGDTASSLQIVAYTIA